MRKFHFFLTIFAMFFFFCLSVAQAQKNATPLWQKAQDEYSNGNYVQAFMDFKTDCIQNNNADACNDVGFMYKEGKGVKKDKKKAVLYFRLACDGKSSLGCMNLGTTYCCH